MLEKVRIKWLPDLCIDAMKVSAQSLDSSSLEAKMVTIHLWPYTDVSKTVTAGLVYLGLYPVSRSFRLSSSSNTLYIITA